LPNPRLLFLYQDCYQALLIGRYNASLVMMGVLLEAVMKERIELKLGEYFSKPFGPCCDIILLIYFQPLEVDLDRFFTAPKMKYLYIKRT